MQNFSFIELVLILGLYYFDKGKNIESFTVKFNQYFQKDIGSQTILYSLSKFKGVDPSNNINSNFENLSYFNVWKEYIEKEKFYELKEIYSNFKKGAFINQICEVDYLETKLYNLIEVPDVITIKDEPQAKPIINSSKGIYVYPRSKEIVINALKLANFVCEADCSTELFLRKSGKINYTEAHHLIPLCYQNSFDYSLDIEANIISLCSNCHNRLHYGFDYEYLLKVLFELRKTRLKSCGIGIDYESLLLLYR